MTPNYRYEEEEIMKPIIGIILCASLMGCESIAPNSANESEIRELIVTLGDQSVSDKEKRQIGKKIKSYGKEALPILITNLEDKSVCFPKMKIRNLPKSHLPLKKTTYAITVGRYCEALLESIITHPDDPTYYHSKHMPYMWKVKDWNKWWQSNKHKRLKQIQQEVMDYNIKELDKEDL